METPISLEGRSPVGATGTQVHWNIEDVSSPEELFRDSTSGSRTLSETSMAIAEVLARTGVPVLTLQSCTDVWMRYLVVVQVVDRQPPSMYLTWADLVRHIGLRVTTQSKTFLQFMATLPWRTVCMDWNEDAHHTNGGRSALDAELGRTAGDCDPTIDGWRAPGWPLCLGEDEELRRLRSLDATRAVNALVNLDGMLAVHALSVPNLRELIREADEAVDELLDDMVWLEGQFLRDKAACETDSDVIEARGALVLFRDSSSSDDVNSLVRDGRNSNSLIAPYKELAYQLPGIRAVALSLWASRVVREVAGWPEALDATAGPIGE